ncbi:hypothetical protein K431DRAFT_303764 [Polychaeton citri CBS 116435]|uniref:Uncharacterized protein n=1 Tax=Polychaeton citri CBS 116435 TaxID=1314669 RepID=A0A9P4QAJ8_9PEZI|nr:hypothetical protein K431DRAFT_303764 [Polychaeton citri CBS 116435]
MFPVDSLPPQYCEDRIAADKAKRDMERQRQLVALEEAAKQIHQITSQQRHQQQQPSSLSDAMRQQRPPLSRPASSSFLGNVFQGFVKARSSPPTTPSTRTPSPSNQKQLGDGFPTAAGSKKPVDSTEQKRKRDEDLLCFLGRA